MRNAVLFLLIITALCSCGQPGSEEQSDEGVIKGLLTFTESGITFLSCETSERYRILDVSHKLYEAMMDHPLQTDVPFYAEIVGEVGSHESRLELDRLLTSHIEVSDVLLLTEEIPNMCDEKMMPVIHFSNQVDKWTVKINYFLPAVVYHYPKYGYKYYFPFDSKEYPNLDEGDVLNWELRGHGKDLVLSIIREDCMHEGGDATYSHRMIFNLDGMEKHACGGKLIGPES